MARPTVTWLAGRVALALAAAPCGIARADPPSGPSALRWTDERPRFAPLEYAVTVAAGTAAIAEYWLVPPQRQPRWVGGALFDDDVRCALQLPSASARHTAWVLADVVGVAEPVLVVGIDSMLA